MAHVFAPLFAISYFQLNQKERNMFLHEKKVGMPV